MCVTHFEHLYVIMYIINITYFLVALYRLYFYLAFIFLKNFMLSISIICFPLLQILSDSPHLPIHPISFL